MLKQSQPTEANKINQQVLKLAGINAVPTTTLGEKLNILDYYINEESLSVAQEKLDEWITIGRNRKSDYVLMNLYAKQSKIANRQDDFDQMDESYKMVFKKLQRDSLQSISIQKLKPEDCKPYGDGRILDIIIEANNNYSKAYDTTSKADYLNKMYNLSTLASSVFSNNYSYLPFNENKYEISAEINEQLLKSALLLDDDGIIDDVLQSIEQTGSKLSWKKFLASNQRENLNIPDSIIERENDLKSELHFYKKSLFTKQESNEEKLKQFKEKIYDIEIEMERLEDWYRKHYPSYFNQTQNRFDLTELKARLKDDQLVVKYVVAQGHVYAFFITKTTTDLVDLGNKEALYKKVTPFVESLSKTNSQDYRQLAKDLYEALLPFSLDKKELVFIQDDLLSLMPMEILLGPTGKYLVQSHTISYAPSLLLWDEQLKVKKSRQNKLGVFAPTYKKQKQKNRDRDADSELIGANTEAMAIGKLFKADVFSGLEATKEQFLGNAKNYNILHLAMHSVINNTDAEFSNLSFSSEADGKLFISELYNIDLDADLAVLSACNTGSGNLEKGEGLINVSRAFTYAGVPSMVTSLWKVPDQETSEIMVSFYKYLKDGEHKNVALQMAKLDYLNNTTDAELKHPYYWAGFVVSGNMEPITSNNGIWRYGLAALFLVGLLFRKRLVDFVK
ncbi:MAG: CHAT domain-containing protein [Maribacter sp.]|nr:CHAT domain-containing protein [Maribacter sp.]